MIAVSKLFPLRVSDDVGPAVAGFELLATSVLLLDGARRVTYANPAAENLFELAKKHLVGHRPDQIFTDATGLTAAIDRAVRVGATYTEQELELGVAGKPKLHLTCTVSPVDTREAALLLEFRQIDQQLKIAREERLERAAAGQPRIDPQSRARDPQPARRHPRRAQLLERELDRPQLIEYTQVVIGEADRLQSLVNRLLTPHRLPTFQPTNIHEIVSRVKSLVQAEFPRVDVICDFDTSLPEFDADPEQLTQATLNIVRNAAQALEATPVDPRIRITTRVARYVTLARKRRRVALALSIEDNGPGIPAAIPRPHLLSARLGPRRRQRPRAHARAGVHRAARRRGRMRERSRVHGVHGAAAARIAGVGQRDHERKPFHSAAGASLREPGAEAGLDRR
jgi:two-component system nitrogen regulation sensor histidine kinase GlnL